MTDHKHSRDPLRNHGYSNMCSCGAFYDEGEWRDPCNRSDATCKTCPWWVQTVEILAQATFYVKHDKGECRRNAPIPSPEDSSSWWPVTYSGDWCGEHPDRQPRPEYAMVTIVGFPTAADQCAL